MHYKWPLTSCGGGGEGGKHLAPIVMVKKSTEIIHIIPTYRVLKKRTNNTNKNVESSFERAMRLV